MKRTKCKQSRERESEGAVNGLVGLGNGGGPGQRACVRGCSSKMWMEKDPELRRVAEP